MHTEYHSASIRQLRDQQVRFAPREKRLEQLGKAEKLLSEVDTKRNYSYEYLCYRITNYRPQASVLETLSGNQAKEDLRCFIEDVSESVNMHRNDAGEPVWSLEDLSKMFNVSTKTISRWRKEGLVSRKFVFGDGQRRRKRVGFLQSSVDRFISRNPERVRRGERFKQMTEADRGSIVKQARRFARAGGTPSEVARRVARRTNRSAETIRYTLKQFDEQFPELAVFPDKANPLSWEDRQEIYQQFLSGTSAELLAARYRRTKATVYRIVNEMRARRILEFPLDFMDNPEFHRRNAEARILAPMPTNSASRKTKPPEGLPRYLAAMYEVPLLSREQEQHLFRKYNYLKYKADKLRRGLDPANVRASLMDEIEELYEQAVRTKNQIVQANLRLVVSIAKRHVNSSDDFFQLISDGNMSLIRAVEKFDYGRGNKFSTYASWSIMRNYARTIPEEFKHRDRYRTSSEEMFTAAADQRTNRYQLETIQMLREQQVDKILDHLDDREQRIIISRFGLKHDQEPRTLKEVGAELGVTKERIRQIEARALNKLRVAAEQERIDIPE